MPSPHVEPFHADGFVIYLRAGNEPLQFIECEANGTLRDLMHDGVEASIGSAYEWFEDTRDA